MTGWTDSTNNLLLKKLSMIKKKIINSLNSIKISSINFDEYFDLIKILMTTIFSYKNYILFLKVMSRENIKSLNFYKIYKHDKFHNSIRRISN
jgi:hypothetical protein